MFFPLNSETLYPKLISGSSSVTRIPKKVAANSKLVGLTLPVEALGFSSIASEFKISAILKAAVGTKDSNI